MLRAGRVAASRLPISLHDRILAQRHRSLRVVLTEIQVAGVALDLSSFRPSPKSRLCRLAVGAYGVGMTRNCLNALLRPAVLWTKVLCGVFCVVRRILRRRRVAVRKVVQRGVRWWQIGGRRNGEYGRKLRRRVHLQLTSRRGWIHTHGRHVVEQDIHRISMR